MLTKILIPLTSLTNNKPFLATAGILVGQRSASKCHSSTLFQPKIGHLNKLCDLRNEKKNLTSLCLKSNKSN